MEHTRRVLVIAATALALAGCGGSGEPGSADRHDASAGPVCNPHAASAIARVLQIAPRTIQTATSIGSNGMPQCTFRSRGPTHRPVQVTVNVDDSPQPYPVLRRTIEEASQYFTPKRPISAPTNVPRLGIAASWFPDYQWLQATDGLRLITARVAWRRAAKPEKIAFARAVIRPYLQTLSRRRVSAIVNGGSIR